MHDKCLYGVRWLLSGRNRKCNSYHQCSWRRNFVINGTLSEIDSLSPMQVNSGYSHTTAIRNPPTTKVIVTGVGYYIPQKKGSPSTLYTKKKGKTKITELFPNNENTTAAESVSSDYSLYRRSDITYYYNRSVTTTGGEGQREQADWLRCERLQ